MKKRRVQFFTLGFGLAILLCLCTGMTWAAGISSHPEAERAWYQGDLQGAIQILELKQSTGHGGVGLDRVLKAMVLQKKKMDQWLEKARELLALEKDVEVARLLSLASAVSTTYPPYVNAAAALEDLKFKKLFPPVMLFDGHAWDTHFKPFNRDASLEEFGKLDPSGLSVSVPENRSWARVGLESREILALPAAGDSPLSWQFDFKFNADQTTGYVIHLDAQETNADFKVVYRPEDGRQASFSLLKNGQVCQKTVVAQGGPVNVRLVLNPDQTCWMETRDGIRLQAPPPEPGSAVKPPRKGYRLQIYSVAEKHKLAARMSLASVSLSRVRPPKPPNLFGLTGQDTRLVLFDGSDFGRIWIPYPIVKHSAIFLNHARTSNAGLEVNVPEKNKWGQAGIASPEPVIWLDELDREGTRYIAVFTFDPEQTTGFTIVFGDINSVWKSPGGKTMQMAWLREPPEGRPVFKVKTGYRWEPGEAPLSDRPPSQVSLAFEKGAVTIRGDTLPEKRVAWPCLVQDAGLHFWVYTLAGKRDAPVKMTLKQIRLVRSVSPAHPAAPAGTKGLNRRELFGKDRLSAWQYADAATASRPCPMESGFTLLEAGPDLKSAVEIRSEPNLITLDKRRIQKGTYRLDFHFDPKRTNSFEIRMGNLAVTLRQIDSGRSLFSLGNARRVIDSPWLENGWNGQIHLTLARKWVHARLGNGRGIHFFQNPRAQSDLRVGLTRKLLKASGGKGRAALGRITGQWIMPQDADSMDKWLYMDDEDFDPRAFLKELKKGMSQ